MQNVVKKVHPITATVLNHFRTQDMKYIMLTGGTHSGKSYSTLEAIFMYCAGTKAGTSPEECRILVSGKDLARLWDGMQPMCDAILSTYPEIDTLVKFNVQRKLFSFATGWELIFAATDNVGKVKALGKCYAHFIDEIDTISPAVWDMASDRATIMVGAWNPSSDFAIEEQRRGKPDTIFYRTTLLDTYRAGLLSEARKRQLDAKLAEMGENSTWAQVYYYGKKGVVESRVFKDVRRCETFPQQCERYEYGADYGSHDPLVLLRIGVWNGGIYIEPLIYESGVEPHNFATKFRAAMGEDAKKSLLICDNNPPMFWQTLKAAGFRAEPTTKGAGSIQYGVDLLSAMPIHIVGYTNAANATFREFTTYERRAKPEGGYYADKYIPNFGDHAIDAARYAYTTITKPKPKPQGYNSHIF